MKVSGLDVHKDSVFCAIYNGKIYSEVNEYAATTLKKWFVRLIRCMIDENYFNKQMIVFVQEAQNTGK
jgi:hypothetical protein